VRTVATSSQAAALAIAGLLAIAPSAAGGTRGNARHPHRNPAPPRPTVALSAHESEFRIRLSRESVPAGRVVIELANVGQDPHDLNLVRSDGPGTGYTFGQARPGTHAAKTVTLAAGTWRLWCSLPGHEAKGMRATLRVTGGK
jgi:hypothetical protein